jgi:hypothetical protein
MSTLQPIANPFALLLDPQQVLASIEHSERLDRLHRRVCRPLDKPAPQSAKKPGAVAASHSFDESSIPTATIRPTTRAEAECSQSGGAFNARRGRGASRSNGVPCKQREQANA